MNNKILIAVIVIILIIAGVYAFTRNNDSENGTEVASDDHSSGTQESELREGEDSIRALMLAGEPLNCEFDYEDGGVTSDGTMHMAEGKMRTDFTTLADGQSTRSHMIIDGEYTYTWMEGEEEGFKFKIEGDAMMGEDTADDEDDANQLNLDQRVNYHCEAWSADQAMFNPPDSVNFTDFSMMMQGNMPGMFEP